MKNRIFFNTFIKSAAYFLCFAFTFSVILILCSPPSDERQTMLPEQTLQFPTVIIDPGHGGEDGGASVEYGGGLLLEKDINLAIALKFYAICKAFGIPCVLTRDTDRLLYTESSHKKAQDLQNRLAFTKQYGDCLLFSIHQNKFPQTSCKGLQVYYSKNNGASQILAESVQNSVLALQPDNHRQIKPADSAIYLLDRAEVPAILVECGFLSNPSDAEKLTQSEYQTMLCVLFLKALSEFKVEI